MAEGTQQSRQTAFIVGTDEIESSEYIVSEGEWEPNYMEIRGNRVSRVNLLGVVVGVESEADRIRSFSIDDGRGSIAVRIFEGGKFPHVEIGDIVIVIGRPRVFNGEKYIVPEIVRQLGEEAWLEVRKRQLDEFAGKERRKAEKTHPENKEPQKNISGSVIDELKEDDSEDAGEVHEIISLIRKYDFGNGADIEEVIRNSKTENAEKIVQSLLNEGEIFEVKSGRLKVLE